MRKPICIILFLCSILLELAGQADTLVTGMRFSDIGFTEFVEVVESKWPVKFYFKEEWVGQLRVTDTTGHNPLGIILDQSFEGKDIHYYCDRSGHIIITKQPLLTIAEDLLEPVKGAKLKEEDPIRPSNGNLQSEKNGKQKYQIIYINGNGRGAQQAETTGLSLSGRILEAETGEPIIGAVVYVENTGTGVITDLNGFYHLNLTGGTHLLLIRSLGREEVRYQMEIHSSGTLDVDLDEKISKLKGVEIVAEDTRNVTRLQMGMNKVDLSTMKQMPAAFGEADVLKTALLLPGVQSVGEGASGFNVRGGSAGQNLFLINDSPIFNSSHLFGFFSVFNPDVVSNFSLYKSGIPAKYGGRLSSIFDVSTKTGNRKKFAASGGISPVTGRLMVEGPIIKDKTSIILGARSTYSDWILNRVNEPSIRNSDANFHDFNLRITHDINPSNKLDLAGYYSYDHFRLNNDTSYNYTNMNARIKYEHQFSDNMHSSFSGIFSKYNYNISSLGEPQLAFELTNEIEYKEVKADFAWYPSLQHKVKFGFSTIFYTLNPGTRTAIGEESLIADLDLEEERGNETSVYISDEFKINNRLVLYGGIRFSSFFYLGPKTVYSYGKDLPLEPSNVIDTLRYKNRAVIKPYMGPEFRFSLRYIIDRYSSLKINYNRMRQYLHMISNTTAISPTDSWKLSDPYLRPQIGDQVSIGYYADLFGNKLESSVELYYKNLGNIVEYKGGATLLLNEMLETELINGTGYAYGLEIMIKKRGRLNGWLSYTFSRVFHVVDSHHRSEQINSGNPYPANHDKPHDITVTGNYKISRRFGISSNFTYSTGRPITYPVSRYLQRNNVLLQYSARNEYRIPDYMRWDISATLFGNLKSKKLAHSDWTLSVYNATGRDNVYSLFFVSTGGETKGYKLSIFNQPIITLTYNFRL